jgi:hypothetical protein
LRSFAMGRLVHRRLPKRSLHWLVVKGDKNIIKGSRSIKQKRVGRYTTFGKTQFSSIVPALRRP